MDVRSIEDHLLGPDPIYSITIIDNFSRAIISSAISPKQDLTAYLIVLYSAVRLHGAPEALASDNGSIFKAKQAKHIYEVLGIRKESIAKRQPWMRYMETTFTIQRRMGDVHFKKANTWEDMHVEHDRWVADYNYQPRLSRIGTAKTVGIPQPKCSGGVGSWQRRNEARPDPALLQPCVRASQTPAHLFKGRDVHATDHKGR